MASVIRFFKRKIKPFKRCVTNPSQTTLSFERQQQQEKEKTTVKRQKSLDHNYYSTVKYAHNEDDFKSPVTFEDDDDDDATITTAGATATSSKLTAPTPTSCPSKFTSYVTTDDQQTTCDYPSTCCTKASSAYYGINDDDDTDDGLNKISTRNHQHQNHATMMAMMKKKQHESTPFFNNMNKHINNEINTELKYALQETIAFDDASTARLSAIKSNSKVNVKRCSNIKSSTLMNGTYTIGNKLKLKGNGSGSIKSSTRKSYRFFSRNNNNKQCQKQQNDEKQQMENQQKENDGEFILPTPKKQHKAAVEIDIISTASAHSDSLCDPLFSSTLKSSSSVMCDDSSVRLEKKVIENQSEQQQGMATVTLSKTAFRKCLSKNSNKDEDTMNNIQENLLFENSMEKMRRSISLPGMNDQLSPILGNLSKFSTIKDAEDIEMSNQVSVNNLLVTTASPHTPILKLVHSNTTSVINSDTFDANLFSLLAHSDNTTSGAATNSTKMDDLSKLRSKELSEAFEEIRNLNGKLNRSKSTLEHSTTANYGEDASTAPTTPDAESSNNYQSKFVRGGAHHKIRMSKTIKQMFKNVVQYQMNALNCLEKFYEAQVLKLETDRRRDLTLNPECKEYIVKFYDLQLAQLEERVYSNLSYICRNRCNGCNTTNASQCNNTTHQHNHNSQSNLMLNNSKMLRMAQLIMQQRKFSHDSSTQNDEFTTQFKRQFSLPYQCRSSSISGSQLPPQPPTRMQLHHSAASRNIRKQKSGKYAKQASTCSNTACTTSNTTDNSNHNSTTTTQKKYPQKRQHSHLNYSTSSDTLSSLLVDQQRSGSTSSINDASHVKRQIKSASSLQVVDENEVANGATNDKQTYSAIKKQNKMLTNGSLTIAMQNATNLSRHSSSSYLFDSNTNNQMSFFTENHSQQSLMRLSDSFQHLKHIEQQILHQPVTSSPTQARRHTYGSDKYNQIFKNSRFASYFATDENIDNKRQRQINSLKETQV